MDKSWFKVSRKGLRKLIAHKNKAFIIHELVQNSWDTEATRVEVEVKKVPGRPAVRVMVKDNDPSGFSDLAHAYTLYAESEKKDDPTKRGRFNRGEKLVLALFTHAEIRSMNGSVRFDDDGLHKGRRKTQKGSIFEGEVRMNQQEFDETIEGFWSLICPDGVHTTLNGETLIRPIPVVTFEEKLPTVISDEEGNLRPTKRITKVEAFLPQKGETGWIYEMGIPICETGDTHNVNVLQKVPLNSDRDNVTDGYKKTLRGYVLNYTAPYLSDKEATELWVTNAMESKHVTAKAADEVMTKRFGKKRVIYDPSDLEANKEAASQGYTVVHGASLPNKAVWDNAKKSGFMKPAGQVTPTPKAYSDDPNAPVRDEIHPKDWTQGMKEVADITRWFAKRVLGIDDLLVMFVIPKSRKFEAVWGCGFEWWVSTLGRKWFDTWYEHPEHMINNIIHELSHEGVSDHLDQRFHRNCTWRGAKMFMLGILERSKIPHFHRVTKHVKKKEAA